MIYYDPLESMVPDHSDNYCYDNTALREALQAETAEFCRQSQLKAQQEVNDFRQRNQL